MRRTLFAASICLLFSITAAGDDQTASKRPPNVVILFTDDQGTLDANCYGSTDLHTPSIDALAASGVRFTQAYSHTVCCPARAMLMTGRHPQRCNVNTWTTNSAKNPDDNQVNMFLDEVTLPEALKPAGYRTALFGKWHLGALLTHGPTRQGFDEFFGHRGGFIDNYNHHFLHGAGFHDLYRGTTEIFRRGEYFPDLAVSEAIRFIEGNRDRPFFLYLAFNIPHYPEQPDTRFDQRYKDLPMPRRSYAKMISTTDDRMGRIVEKLDELGLRENTVIIYMSDNGHSEEDSFIRVDNHASGLPQGHHYGANGGGGNTGKWRGCKGTLFEGGIRVPAIISFPKALPQGVVRDQAITACDWFPTVLDLCGVPPPEGVTLDGASLVPIIRQNTPSHYEVMHWQWQTKWAVREGDWKLINDARLKRANEGPVFLGNLADEMPEAKNYAEEKPELVEHLQKLHDEWVRGVTPVSRIEKVVR